MARNQGIERDFWGEPRHQSMKWTNVPIPEGHVVALFAGIILHVVVPMRLLPKAWLGQALDWPILGAGLLLTGWAVSEPGEMEIEA